MIGNASGSALHKQSDARSEIVSNEYIICSCAVRPDFFNSNDSGLCHVFT